MITTESIEALTCEAVIEKSPLADPRTDCGTSAENPHSVSLWKRLLDIALIAITAPAWGTLMIGIGAAIKVLSPGSTLFRQQRIGMGGTTFVCLKFRTMRTGASTVGHENYLAELVKSGRPMTKLDGTDVRLIPMAWVLRSTGLDELPQLFNVLRGEMSLVGPRPCTPEEYKNYSAAQRARSATLPGLTGLWQVSGKNRTTFKEMIALDLAYIETLSFSRDIRILVGTPIAVLKQVVETILHRRKARSATNEALAVSCANPAPLGIP